MSKYRYFQSFDDIRLARLEVGATMTQRTIKEAAANDAWTTTAIMGESSASLLIHCMQYQAINRCFHSHVL